MLGVALTGSIAACDRADEAKHAPSDATAGFDVLIDGSAEGGPPGRSAVDGSLLDVVIQTLDGQMMDAHFIDADSGSQGSIDVGARDGGSPVPDALTRATLDAATLDAVAVDAAEPDADSPPDAENPPRERRCNDALDDDGDGHVDCEDPDCRGAPVCFDLREICDDGRDNNGDERVDCDDVTCHLEPGCPAPEVEAFTTEQVEARFVLDCVPCHGAPQPEVQLDLTPPFLDRVLNVPSFQVELPYIKSGDASQSWIYHKIRYRQIDFMGDGDGMPPEHTWTAQDVQRLGLWIDALPQ